MKRQLSPKQFIKRMQDHQQAVIVLMRMRARKAVEGDLKSKGVRVRLVRPAAINELAHEYLAQHRERLRAEVEHAIATWPGFAQWRKPDAPFMEK
jgi:hypothetical protein